MNFLLHHSSQTGIRSLRLILTHFSKIMAATSANPFNFGHLALFIICIVPSVVSLRLNEVPVNVELVHRRRVHRSLPETDQEYPDYEYNVKIRALDPNDGVSYDLKLAPVTRSVFGAGFKYTHMGSDESGAPRTHVRIPTRAELSSIESNLYSDPNSRTSVRLRHDKDGNLNLNGMVHGSRIRTRRSAQGADEGDEETDSGNEGADDANGGNEKASPSKGTKTKPVYKTVTYVDISVPRDPKEKDYVSLPPGVVVQRRAGAPVDLSKRVVIEPELAFVLDTFMAKDIGGDWQQKLEYVAITVNGINGYYELTSDSISIKCELVNVVEIESEARSFIGKVSRTSVNDPAGNFVYLEAVADDVLNAYGVWAFENAKDLGDYDMAPLLTGVKFKGSTAGIASSPGACMFNAFTGRGRSSLASPAASDRGANFEGIPVMAHEIGHNIGSPHDGESAKSSGDWQLPDTTACPFSDGYLMGYNRTGVYNNPFRFSTCSLNAIKTFLGSPSAACLYPNAKTGRPIIHKSDKEGGDIGTPEATCRAVQALAFQGTVAYQTPDESCREVKCELKRGGSVQTVRGSIVPPRNTPCGDNSVKGRCRNGFCIRQGPPVDPNQLCKLLRKTPDAELYVDEGRGETMDSVCAGPLKCLSGQTISTIPDIVPVVGTPCGNGKICFNKQCVAKDSISDPNLECIIQTGKQEAKKAESDSKESGCAGTICRYATEFEYLGEDRPACVPYSFRASGSLGSPGSEPLPPIPTNGLQDVCVKVTGEKGARVKSFRGRFDRNELCSRLQCIKENGNVMTSKDKTPDGTRCGPLRRCKNGKCVICGASQDSKRKGARKGNRRG